MQKKSHLKNLLAVFLAAMMILSAVPLSLAADGQLGYTPSEDGDYYMVSSCPTFAVGNVTVPSTYKEKPVLKILKGAFNNCYYLSSIEVSEGITEIETEAVKDCDSLFSITIAKSVKTIGEKAFGFDFNGNAIEGFAVNGYANSAAAEYAKANGFTFTNICKHESFELSNVIKATCTVEGYSGDKVCKDCGEVLGKGETVPMTGHNYVDDVTKPTCTEKGFTSHICSVCKDSYIDSYVDAKGHTPAEAVKENVIPATCKSEGSYDSVVKCSVCNTEISRKPVKTDKLPHSEEILPAVPATCIKTGLTEGKKCSVCGEVIVAQQEVQATGHKNKVHHEKVEPTCTKKGTIEYWECPDCSKNFSDENCTVEAETLEIAEAAHTEEILPAVPATCTKTGLTEGKKCSVCGEVLVAQQKVPMTDHTFGDWKITTPATCKNEGEKTRTCSVCKEATETEKIAVNPENHAGGTEIKDEIVPTCKEGYTGNTYCLGCGKLIATGSNVKDPGNHDGGTEIRDDKAATCTEDGYTGNTYCLGCGKLIATGSSSEKTEHNFGEWEVVTAATCTEDGLEKRVCKNDETHVEERTIAAKGHTPETVGAKDATCTEDGYTGDSVCKTCNATLETGKVIAAKGHVDEDGDSVCDVCKEKLSSETPETPCDCACHQKGFKKLWFKICLFFQMIFDKNRVCKCGVWHY